MKTIYLILLALWPLIFTAKSLESQRDIYPEKLPKVWKNIREIYAPEGNLAYEIRIAPVDNKQMRKGVYGDNDVLYRRYLFDNEGNKTIYYIDLIFDNCNFSILAEKENAEMFDLVADVRYDEKDGWRFVTLYVRDKFPNVLYDLQLDEEGVKVYMIEQEYDKVRREQNKR